MHMSYPPTQQILDGEGLATDHRTVQCRALQRVRRAHERGIKPEEGAERRSAAKEGRQAHGCLSILPHAQRLRTCRQAQLHNRCVVLHRRAHQRCCAAGVCRIDIHANRQEHPDDIGLALRSCEPERSQTTVRGGAGMVHQ
eukprot:1529970-Prymnesium_polylepis.1